ncbi:MAG: hypothetical protein ACM3ZE_26305, partial [Myxococcales bacterium]
MLWGAFLCAIDPAGKHAMLPRVICAKEAPLYAVSSIPNALAGARMRGPDTADRGGFCQLGYAGRTCAERSSTSAG